jgi:V8-like Glu-specific endopeptidase
MAGSGPIEFEIGEDVDLAEITHIEALPIAHDDLVDLGAVGHDLVVENGDPDFENAVELRRFIDDATIDPPDDLIDKAVIGADSRVPVKNTRVDPYKAVVNLAIKFLKHDPPGRCTGTMIAKDAVLTAAHCVFDSDKSLTGYAYSVTVVPALYPKDPLPASGTRHNAPFGTGYGGKLFVPSRYIANESDDHRCIPHDFAVVRLKAPLNTAGVRKYGVLGKLIGQPTVLHAYHGDKVAALQMYESRDQVRQVVKLGYFNHYTDSKVGSSGGGIVGTGAWANKVYAVNSTEDARAGKTPYNMAAPITLEVYRTISQWVTAKWQ